MTPPKPKSRTDKVSLWRYMRLFRRDILSAQPAKLYRAWMAEFRTPFFRSYLVNDPALVKTVLQERAMDFPKSDRIGAGLRPLLRNSVFLTNGATWQRQRRIIDPAFEGGNVRESFAAMDAAALDAIARLRVGSDAIEIEEFTSRLAADVIFRTMFSIPITDEIAGHVFEQFRTYQRSQPILNLAAFVKTPSWFPRFFRKDTKSSAKEIRRLIAVLTHDRAQAFADGTAPDDLVTKIMTTVDPETGRGFDTEEMIDQVAIFFLAGHETSASALAWAFYLLATHPDAQARVAEEAREFATAPVFASLSKLTFTRNVFRETLRLYPPVPMMVRETTGPEVFREREIAPGSQVVISPWHLQRHERLWDDPDGFDPDRFASENGKRSVRDAYIPFSSGPRVCPGAGFAMIEGTLLLARLIGAFQFDAVAGKIPIPVAHLTVRSVGGIWLNLSNRFE